MHPDARDDDRRITYFAATHTRGKREMFGIRAIDRGKHMYVIGKTGMGKSTMLENMAIQDIQHGEGIAFIDPHGSTAEKLLDFVPHDRIQDVIYFAPFDTENPIGFNVMEDVGYDKRHLVVSGLIGAFKRIWVDAFSARMEYFLQNSLLALLEYPGSTLLDVNRMLTNKTFRDDVVANVKDPIVRAFWVEEFAGFTDTYTREATPAIQNKIGAFVSNPLVRNIIGQPTSSFDLRKVMDEKKIFIVNLSKGRMGETNASLLGSMLTVKIYLAAMSRAEESAARMARLPRCYFYVDEFQSMMNDAFADILSEARKYKLALTLANQYVEQMEEKVRAAVFGNVGTTICFRVGPFDAETLQTVFEPTFQAEDLINLGVGEIYLTLMIDGVGSPPFSAETIPPIEAPAISYREDVVTHSRAVYGRPRSTVDQAIIDNQLKFAPPPPKSKTQIRKEENGNRYGASPRPARVESPTEQRVTRTPLELMREAQAATPAPAPHVEVVVRPTPVTIIQTSVPAPSPAPVVAPPAPKPEVQQRSALRDAISHAQKVVTPAPAPIRSPADILRSRVQPSSQPSRPKEQPQPTPQQTHQSHHHHQQPRREEPSPRPQAQTPQTPEKTDDGNGEVSAELLKRVLNDGEENRGHEDT